MLYRPEASRSIAIDLSPLIDVVFLLLIFFMVSTRFKDDRGLDLNLPKSDSRQEGKAEHLTISLDKNQVIRIGDDQVSLGELGTRIERELPGFEDKMVILKVDETVNHGTVVRVMDAAKSAGATGITYATQAKGN